MISDAEMQRRLKILKERIESGKISFGPEVMKGVEESLMRVRYKSDGSVNLDTVDDRVRSLANVVAGMQEREEAKKIPLSEVQEAYFELVETFLRQPYQEMLKHKLNPHQVAMDASSRAGMVEAFKKDRDGFLRTMADFWLQAEPIVGSHLEETSQLRAVFGGDIFPSYRKNIATSVGLYMDTIVLPDPLLKVCTLIKSGITPEKALYYFVKHGLNVLGYKELALTDVDPPIVVIAPNPCDLNTLQIKLTAAFAETDVLEHVEWLFGKKFSAMEEVWDFSQSLKKAEDVAGALVHPDRLLFDTDWKEPLVEQIQKSQKEMKSQFTSLPYDKTSGSMIIGSLVGRMTQANDIVFSSRRYGGLPLVDAETSWQYLLWKYEYDAKKSSEKPTQAPMVISKALTDMQEHEKILYDVDPAVLIELRKGGVMQELRETIAKGIGDIEKAEDVQKASETVIANLKEAFAEHSNKIHELSTKKAKFAGVGVGSWLLTGGLSIAAAATGYVTLGVVTAILGAVGSPSAKDLYSNWKEIQKEGKKLHKTSMGILYRHFRSEKKKD